MLFIDNNRSDEVDWVILLIFAIFIAVTLKSYVVRRDTLKACEAQGYTAIVRGAGEWFTYHCVK